LHIPGQETFPFYYRVKKLPDEALSIGKKETYVKIKTCECLRKKDLLLSPALPRRRSGLAKND
jgi:hypothetical protein